MPTVGEINDVAHITFYAGRGKEPLKCERILQYRTQVTLRFDALGKTHNFVIWWHHLHTSGIIERHIGFTTELA